MGIGSELKAVLEENYTHKGHFYVFYSRKRPKSEFSVVFEGLDGCGKDTQIILMLEYLRNKEISHFFTDYPDEEVLGWHRRIIEETRAMNPDKH